MFTCVNPNRTTLFIYLYFNFFPLKGNSPCLKPPFSQYPCQFVKGEQLFAHTTFSAVDDLLSFIIAESPVGIDNGPPKPFLLNFCLIVHHKYGGKAKLIFIGTKRTNKIRQPFRQHGN